MVKVFGSTLPGKTVMGVDGSVLGKLINVMVDKKGVKTDGDYLVVPASAVRSIRDYIVVDKQRLMRGSSVVEEI